MTTCRISGLDTTPLFSLGNLYASDFVVDSTIGNKGDLSLCMSPDSKLVQLESNLPCDALYGKYWYRSGTNSSMRMALMDVVSKGMQYSGIKEGDVWLDIACNDGTLLSFVSKSIVRVGIDPAEDSYRKESLKVSNDIIQDFFSLSAWQSGKYSHKKAKVITAIAMFYDLNDPCSFMHDIEQVLDDDGLLILQLSYTPLMIEQLAFDNICHEHLCYYSLTSLKYLMDKAGFRIVDCELNDVNGGSFRVYIKKASCPISNFKTSPFRDVSNFRIQSLLQYEEKNGFNSIDRYKKFFASIEELRLQTIDFIITEYMKGKRIWGYGASTKGNTLLQWYGLTYPVIEAIAERNPSKHGLRTIGTNIPICSEEAMRKFNPDYLLILPWHFIEEFRQREKEYLNKGGTFIVPCPRFELIGK